METIKLVIYVSLTLMCGVGAFLLSFDLKKWYYWLFSLSGLLIGLVLGIETKDLYGGLALGLLFTILTIYIGATNYWHRQRYKDIANHLFTGKK